MGGSLSGVVWFDKGIVRSIWNADNPVGMYISKNLENSFQLGVYLSMWVDEPAARERYAMPDSAEMFGEKLLRLRTEQGLTRYALAKKCGLSQAGLLKLENGERQPAWDTVQKIALALGVECTAFTDSSIQLPEEQEPKKRGRPKQVPLEPPAVAKPAAPARKGRARKGGAG
jgi:transcriptional regulator with XRE-family HTH domain